VAVHLDQRSLEGLPLALAQRLDGPVLLGLEGADLPLPLDEQAEGDGLYPTGGEAGLDGAPEDGAGLVAHQPVEDPAGLLGVHLPLVDLPRLPHGGEHGVPGDLLEQDPVYRDLGVELVGHVPGDGLALPVGVGGQVDGSGGLGGLLQLREGLGLSFNGDVLGLEPVLHVHAQLPGREVAEVPDGGLHVVAGAQVFPDGLRLGGRLDDDERTPPPGRRRAVAGRLRGLGTGPGLGGFLLHRSLGSCRHIWSVISAITVWSIFGNSKKGAGAGRRKAKTGKPLKILQLPTRVTHHPPCRRATSRTPAATWAASFSAATS
jgi:hypothetical protein